MCLPFLEYPFNSRNNTVDIVIESIAFLDYTDKNLKSRYEMEEMPGSALAMGIN